MSDKIKRVLWEALQNDPTYKKLLNWKMVPKNLTLIEDSLIGRNADYAERVAMFSLIIPENGGSPDPHGNDAFGLVGWRGTRAIGLPKDLPGLIHKLMEETYNNPKAKDWNHGGKGSGVNSGKEMLLLFRNTLNTKQATKAFMKGYVRPPKESWNDRLLLVDLIKKYMK